jgi:outer membrane protein TolC
MQENKHARKFRMVFGIGSLLFAEMVIPFYLNGQQQFDSIHGEAGLESCLEYTFRHQPLVKQLKIRNQIVRNNIGSALSGWLPQVDLNANYQHYMLQPVSIFPDFSNPDGPKREVTTGVVNSSAIQFNASQVIYDPDVVIAGTSARYYRLQSEQSNEQSLIDLVVRVSKAFYDVLLSQAKLDFFIEDRSRIDKSLKDASSLYETGLSDKIDYQRAQISLNNIDAEIHGAREEIRARFAVLKELMGYPPEVTLSVTADSASIARSMMIDTTMTADSRKRVEYQLLLTNIRLQHAEVTRNRLGFLPSLSAYGIYNLVYQNDDFNALYNRDFPNSSAGLRLSLPLFQGGKRLFQLKTAQLALKQMLLDTLNLSSRMRTEFENAMASYKSNTRLLQAARQNVVLAEAIYNTIRLQYSQGIKSFLEVIVSEADLRSAKINELNALYRLITSRLDVDAATGSISVNY